MSLIGDPNLSNLIVAIWNTEFEEFVKINWKICLYRGKKAYIIKEKFKILKGILRVSNREIFGWLDLKVEEYINQINYLDIKL